MNDLASTAISIYAMGKPCPMPLLMLKRAIKNKSEHLFLLKSSDPHSQQDVVRYCQIHQLKCTMTKITDFEYHYLIES